MTRKRTAIIFSRQPASFLKQLIQILRRREYDVPLVVCCPGSGYLLAREASTSMGHNVGAIIDEIDNPPAVLCITKMSQVEKLYEALDPDLALAFSFSYQITSRLLSHRAPFVNMHPTRLPYGRGPNPYHWMALRPDLYPLSKHAVTWQYMSKEYDQGRIILQKPAPLVVNQPDFAQIIDASTKAFIDSADEVLQLIEDGFQGIEQSELLEDGDNIHSEALKYMTSPSDEQRTITSDMSIEEVQSLLRSLRPPFPALFRYNDQLYYVVRVTPVTQEEVGSLATQLPDADRGNGNTIDGAQKRVGSSLLQTFRDGALSMAIRKI
ncbi:MAG: hypothetical protein Q9195_006919 [Heterodermia aff. obscurata]